MLGNSLLPHNNIRGMMYSGDNFEEMVVFLTQTGRSIEEITDMISIVDSDKIQFINDNVLCKKGDVVILTDFTDQPTTLTLQQYNNLFSTTI